MGKLRQEQIFLPYPAKWAIEYLWSPQAGVTQSFSAIDQLVSSGTERFCFTLAWQSTNSLLSSYVRSFILRHDAQNYVLKQC